MIVYTHKVKMRPFDGWGRDLPERTETLGTYSTFEKAEAAKKARDESTDDQRYCDVGSSWISVTYVD